MPPRQPLAGDEHLALSHMVNLRSHVRSARHREAHIVSVTSGLVTSQVAGLSGAVTHLS